MNNIRVSHKRLIRVCHVDYDRDIALIALDKSSSSDRLVAAARLTKEHGKNIAEFSVLVADDYQGVSLFFMSSNAYSLYHTNYVLLQLLA